MCLCSLVCRGTDDLNVTDGSLTDFIGVKGRHAVFLPHTAGRYQSRPFRKTACPIVERLVNSMMMHGRNNGKKLSVPTASHTLHTSLCAENTVILAPRRRLARSDGVRSETITNCIF